MTSSKNNPQGLAHAKKLIAENKAKKEPFLDLGNCGLRDLSELPELWELGHLEGLNLSFGYYTKDGSYNSSNNNFFINEIGKEGAQSIAENLKQLTSLHLSSIHIGIEGTIAIAENLKLLTSLNLSSNEIGVEGTIAIAENLKLLTFLDLSSNQIGDDGAKAIAENLKLLTSLNLFSNQIGDDGAKAIAENLILLSSLDLSYNQIGDDGARAIAGNLKLLTTLNLSYNKIGDKGAKTIAENLKLLTTLKLSNNQIGGEGAKAIAENLKLLTSLYLASNQIGDDGAKAIAENLKLLTSLNLSSNLIGGDGTKSIAENLKLLTFLNLSSNQIGGDGAQAIAANLKLLTSLNLSYNKIGDYGAEAIAENLKLLTSLYISFNQIGDKGAQVIAENLKLLTSLDLSSNLIGYEGAQSIGVNLKLLTSLDLSFCKIRDKGVKAIAENLGELTSLDLSDCKIGDEGTKAISENLGQLTSLDLSENKIGDEGAKSIAINLGKLTSLQLWSNKIGVVGAKAIAKNLGQLTSLIMWSNQIGDMGAIAIAENLGKLTSLDLGSNKIGDEGAKVIAKNLCKLSNLDLDRNQITYEGVKAIAENLGQLTSLGLGDSEIGEEGAKAIAENLLKLISLNLAGCKIGDEGAKAIATNLEQLTWLNLESNIIGDEGAKAIAENIKRIDTLILTRNKISSFFPFLTIIKNYPNLYLNTKDEYEFNGLNLSKNPFTEPPIEIVNQGKEVILEYFRQKELTDSKLLLEAKMVLLGDGRAGKTSLARRLIRKELPNEADRTKGVDIVIGDYIFPVEDGDFKLNIWDFAGQDKYKPLHQFFYSESTLYVMVADSGNANTDFADWFETANLYGEGSPLIVVLNEFSDGLGFGTFAEDHWRSQFPNLIKEVHVVNLLKKKDISILERDIKHYARQLPHVQYNFPTNWVNIRAELERRKDENFISLYDYIRICKENNLPERKSALILSSVLHKIGVCLHYQKSELLNQHIILKNEWATTAVYKILEDHKISEVKKGFFDLDDLRRIWSDTEYQDMIPQLLALMCEFKLTYPLPIKNEYVAPPLLPQAQPRDIEIDEANAIQVAMEFEFLPKALLTQFIVSRHTDIDNNRTMVWRDGVVLRWPSNTKAIIRKIKSRGRDAFQILVSGTEQRGLLTSIIKTMRDLCDEYKGIRVQEIVKCPCPGCQSGNNEQHFFDFKNLTHRLEKGRRTVECDKSLEEVDLLKLLGSLFIFEEIHVGQKVELKDVQKELKTIKIFLASSSELAKDRDDFDLYFRQQNDYLKDEGIYLKIVRWENFLDAMSETRLQDEYNKEVSNCDIFVSLFFTKTGKYTEEEFDVAHRQFMDSGGEKPKIYTFFKKGDVKIENINQIDINTLLNFKSKLDSLGHFYTQYDNLADLKLRFRDQLTMLNDNKKI